MRKEFCGYFDEQASTMTWDTFFMTQGNVSFRTERQRVGAALVTSDLFRWCDSLPHVDATAKSSTRKPHKKVRFWHFSVVIASPGGRGSVRSRLRRSRDR